MVKVYKVVVMISGMEQVVTETAKNVKDLVRKLELRNYKIKQIIGEV